MKHEKSLVKFSEHELAYIEITYNEFPFKKIRKKIILGFLREINFTKFYVKLISRKK